MVPDLGREPWCGFGVTLTLRRQEVGQHHQARNEHARYDDVNDVEKRLPADDECVDDISFSQVVCRATVLVANDSRAEVDGPLAVLCWVGGAVSCSQRRGALCRSPATPETCNSRPRRMHLSGLRVGNLGQGRAESVESG